jgi:hypothetical protein
MKAISPLICFIFLLKLLQANSDIHLFSGIYMILYPKLANT